MDLQGAELVCIFASPYTHPNDSIDMENREIYKAIKSIADELCSDGKTFLRADLAYELKKYGVAGDSSEVGAWSMTRIASTETTAISASLS